MPRKKLDEKVEPLKKERFYKGYDMKWLAKEPNHPDYYLVKEYEKEVKE